MKKMIAWCDARQSGLGMLMLVFGSTMAIVGFPLQIWKTYIDQKVGIHWTLIILPILIYTIRIPYSVSKRAWALIAPDAIGLLSCLLLLAQFYFYYNMGR